MEKSFEIKEVPVAALNQDNLQIRVEMNEECVQDYAESYQESPDKLPPVIVFHDENLDKFYLADGFHRVAAVVQNGGSAIRAEVRPGTFDDALKFALSANVTNGLRRTNADKRHAVEVAWANWPVLLGDEKPQGEKDGKPTGLPSARQLASLCCVSHDFANRFMKLSGVSSDDTPQLSSVTGKPLLCTMTGDKQPSALVSTNQHFEERSESVRSLLKQKKDRFGIDIPDKLYAAFTSRFANALERDIKSLIKRLDRERLDGNIALANFIGYAMRDLDAVLRDIKHGEIYCVCRMCRGRGCGSCGNLGFQTRLQYERNPVEFKAEGL